MGSSDSKSHSAPSGCRPRQALAPTAQSPPPPRASDRSAAIPGQSRASPLADGRCHGFPLRRRVSSGVSSLLGLRSEEHTSELQSLMRISYAVFCLKKKTYINRERMTQYRLNTHHWDAKRLNTIQTRQQTTNQWSADHYFLEW